MNNDITGKLIKELREKMNKTQKQLADELFISEKTISKWETGKGCPDISLLEPLSKALGVSLIELLKGENIENFNKCGNVKKSNFYVCPICNNVVYSLGNALVSCCGITLCKLNENLDNNLTIETVEDEYLVTASSQMTKEDYVSFIAMVEESRVDIVKLYPEEQAIARFTKRSKKPTFYYYSTKSGLFKK